MAGSGRTWTSAALVAAVITLGGAALTTSAASPGASSFVPITPCRLFDTRTGLDNVGPRDTPIQSNETYTVPVWGTNGDCTIPTGATGVTMNVAIVNPTGNSFLTVFPGDASKPLAANLNWVTGQAPTPNAVTAALGADGTLSFYNLTGTVDLAVDINGYYEAASGSGTGPQGPPGDPGPQPAQIVWVAKSGGDFTSVNAALASITDASASKRYLIKIAPGEYTEPPIDLKTHVDLEGSGPRATVIRCDCIGSQSPLTGTNAAAINIGAGVITSVRDLTVTNVATGDAYGAGIRTASTLTLQVTLQNVSVSVTNANVANYGIVLLGGATITDATVLATSGSTATARAVYVDGSSVVLRRMNGSAIVGSSGTAYGLISNAASITLDDSVLSASAGTGSGFGMSLTGGSATVTDSTLTGVSGGNNNGIGINAFDVSLTVDGSTARGAIGGSGTSWGVLVTKAATITDSNIGSGSEIGVEAATPVPVGSYIVTISGSSVSGSVNTAKSTTNATVRIGNSVVAGGPVSAGGGSISCAFVTDENGVGTASTCPG